MNVPLTRSYAAEPAGVGEGYDDLLVMSKFLLFSDIANVHRIVAFDETKKTPGLQDEEHLHQMEL